MKNRVFIIVYYVVLFALLMTTFMRVSPLPMAYRILYLVLMVLPAIKYNYLFLPCLILFYSVAALSLGFTFLPTEMSYYVLLSGLMVAVGFLTTKQTSFPIYPIILFAAFWALIISVNVINSGSIEKISYSLLCFVLLLATVNKQDMHRVLLLIPYAFIIATLACSILLLINRDYFMVDSGEEFERLMTASINYSCQTIAIGSVLAFMLAIRPTSRMSVRLLCMATFGISIVALLLEASRGALLSIAIACSLIILFSKTKSLYKIIGILLVIVFVIVLYQNNTLDLLIYRFQEDDGTGSNRTYIWSLKLHSFWNEGNSFEYLFGIGFDRTIYLGKSAFLHNDFLAFFIEYGFIGFCLFLSFVLYPLFKADKDSRPTIIILIAFILTHTFLLEPFSIGYMPIYFLLLYIYLLAFNQDGIQGRSHAYYLEKSMKNGYPNSISRPQ